ncbi:MAG TPA: energy transducer TonB [Bacteroidia bacterium]|nr:energy transducer TonB [Bacteroidia bacterium]
MVFAQDSTLTFRIQNESHVYTQLDTMPQFKGDLYIYMQSKIIYPLRELEEGISGTVYVGFIVEKNGILDSIKIVQGVERGLDIAAIMAVKKMPKFIPGIKNGKAVRVQYSLPVNFVLR